jgi:hypothetical protein
MSRRITLTDDELYIIRQALQDINNSRPISYFWAYEYLGRAFLHKLIAKLDVESSPQEEKTS